jgi:hypothetical protein
MFAPAAKNWAHSNENGSWQRYRKFGGFDTRWRVIYNDATRPDNSFVMKTTLIIVS